MDKNYDGTVEAEIKILSKIIQVAANHFVEIKRVGELLDGAITETQAEKTIVKAANRLGEIKECS